MKTASDFREIAREVLCGKWKIAVIAGLIASLLGGIAGSGPEVRLDIDISTANVSFKYADQVILSTNEGINTALIASASLYVALAVIALGTIYFVLGSIVEIGYARFNLDLNLGHAPEISKLFDYISYWKTTSAARLLKSAYILLWSLLLVIPGVMASYSYAMTEYILAENPDMTASEAIACSKDMMRGNRWRLFCLHISFIGWDILTVFTFGIGNLWLTPYRQAAEAAFYQEISEIRW